MHQHTVQVTTASGVVEGFTRDGVNRWRSIPYAAPPVGPLRFRAPQPVTSLTGVRSAHGYRNCAPQQKRYTMTGVGKYQPMSEDCLTLNVVSPRWDGPAPEGEPLPVMFSIHGGGYIPGSSATPLYDGAALAPARLRVRVGQLPVGRAGLRGLLLAGHPGDPIESNLLLRDIVAALRWVRDNIGARC